MASPETSLCVLPVPLETRGPIRKAYTPLWPAHPCQGNSPQAQTDCLRHRRAWISSRSRTRVLLESEDKRPAGLPQQAADQSLSPSLSLRCRSARLCMPTMLRTQTNSASMPMTSSILLRKILLAGGRVDYEASRACFLTTMSPRSEAPRNCHAGRGAPDVDQGEDFLGTPLLIHNEQLLLQGLKLFWHLPHGRHRKAWDGNKEFHSVNDPKR